MADERMDSDYLKLKNQVREGFAENSKEHREIMDTVKEQAHKMDIMEQNLVELTRANEFMRKTMFGNGRTGCLEIQRNTQEFLRTFKKVLWLMLTPALIGFAALAISHLLEAK